MQHRIIFAALLSICVFSDARERTEDAILAELSPGVRAYVLLRLSGERLPALSANSPEDLKTGQVGELVRNGSDYTYRVNQVIDERNMLIFGGTIWVEGVPTSDIVDDSSLSLQGFVFEVKGTKRFESATGASRTVRYVAAIDTRKAEETVEEIRLKRRHRTWQDSTGKFSVAATFVKSDGGKVYLLKDDGDEVVLDLFRLSKSDQTWIRDELKRIRDEELSRKKRSR